MPVVNAERRPLDESLIHHCVVQLVLWLNAWNGNVRFADEMIEEHFKCLDAQTAEEVGLEKADMSKAPHELGLPESEERTMILEDRRVRNFFRSVAGIGGGLMLLHPVAQLFTGFGYRYFVVNDVLLHWLLAAAGICLVSWALSSGIEK